MASTLSELPVIPLDQHAFNLKRWEEICADETLAACEFRIETDEFGRTIMSPPPAPEHGEEQSEVSHLIRIHAKFPGRTITECPVSTSGGVKAADVAWISMERREAQRGQKAFTTAPEICVEVLSPPNTRNEIEEKKALYFESGAEEVWICGLDGTIDFFLAGAPDVPAKSDICPDCPLKVVLS